MTKYEYLNNEANKCMEKAKNTTSLDLRKFYINAYFGFIQRIQRLSVEQAELII